MSRIRISLKDAFRTLEIGSAKGLKEKDLPRLRRKALKRWHPDTIAHTNPSESQQASYENNFRLVDPAIETLRQHLRSVSSGSYAQPTDRNPVTNNATVGVSVSQMQTVMRQVLRDVRRKKQTLHVSEKEHVFSKGVILREALRQDLNDNVIEVAITNWYGFCLISLFFGLLISIIGSDPDYLGLAHILFAILFVIWCLQTLASSLFLLPLSRFWLPWRIAQVATELTNMGQYSLRLLQSIVMMGCALAGLFMLPLVVAQILIMLIKNFLIAPLYWVIGYFWGDRQLFVETRTVRYVGGILEQTLHQIVCSDPRTLSQEQLKWLRSAYSHYAKPELNYV
ncbi:MAG: hypothetical protein AAGD25_15165 [Cyanobacteria bacterium P01_F01_bin.150]